MKLPLPDFSNYGNYTDHRPDVVCIAWIDSLDLTRQCITQAVTSVSQSFRVFSFKAATDFREAREQKIDLIVYHAYKTDTVSAADIATLRRAFASTRLVVLSDASSLDPTFVRGVLLQGASGFVLTAQTGLQVLLSSLALVASGGSLVPKELVYHQEKADQPIAREPLLDPVRLTKSELKVLQLLKEGKANKVIAAELQLSESTVKVHVRNSMRKIGSSNRTHLAMNVDSYVEARLKYS